MRKKYKNTHFSQDEDLTPRNPSWEAQNGPKIDPFGRGLPEPFRDPPFLDPQARLKPTYLVASKTAKSETNQFFWPREPPKRPPEPHLDLTASEEHLETHLGPLWRAPQGPKSFIYWWFRTTSGLSASPKKTTRYPLFGPFPGPPFH